MVACSLFLARGKTSGVAIEFDLWKYEVESWQVFARSEE
jgi:hypothetical protein